MELFVGNITKLRNLADKFRNALGNDDELSIDQMAAKFDTNEIGKRPTLKTTTVTPTKSTQNVTADGYDEAYQRVTVNPIPSEYIVPSGSQTLVSNGDYNVTSLSSVTVAVPGSGGAMVEQGTCTMTSSLLTINHGLGVKPNFVIAWCAGTSSNTQRTHVVVYDSKVSTTQAKYQYYRSDAGVNKNVSTSKGSTSYVYIGADAVTLPYYSSSYAFSGTYYYIVGTYS